MSTPYRYVRNYMDLTLSHLPAEEQDGLLSGPVPAHKTAAGVWVYVPVDDADFASRDFAAFPHLREMLVYVRQGGCDWVQLSEDGGVLHHSILPTFERPPPPREKLATRREAERRHSSPPSES